MAKARVQRCARVPVLDGHLDQDPDPGPSVFVFTTFKPPSRGNMFSFRVKKAYFIDDYKCSKSNFNNDIAVSHAIFSVR